MDLVNRFLAAFGAQLEVPSPAPEAKVDLKVPELATAAPLSPFLAEQPKDAAPPASAPLVAAEVIAAPPRNRFRIRQPSPPQAAEQEPGELRMKRRSSPRSGRFRLDEPPPPRGLQLRPPSPRDQSAPGAVVLEESKPPRNAEDLLWKAPLKRQKPKAKPKKAPVKAAKEPGPEEIKPAEPETSPTPEPENFHFLAVSKEAEPEEEYWGGEEAGPDEEEEEPQEEEPIPVETEYVQMAFLKPTQAIVPALGENFMANITLESILQEWKAEDARTGGVDELAPRITSRSLDEVGRGIKKKPYQGAPQGFPVVCVKRRAMRRGDADTEGFYFFAETKDSPGKLHLSEKSIFVEQWRGDKCLWSGPVAASEGSAGAIGCPASSTLIIGRRDPLVSARPFQWAVGDIIHLPGFHLDPADDTLDDKLLQLQRELEQSLRPSEKPDERTAICSCIVEEAPAKDGEEDPSRSPSPRSSTSLPLSPRVRISTATGLSDTHVALLKEKLGDREADLAIEELLRLQENKESQTAKVPADVLYCLGPRPPEWDSSRSFGNARSQKTLRRAPSALAAGVGFE